MVHSALLTSNDQSWETPQRFFKKIDSTYQFTLDACANENNAKCERYFNEEQDGLSQSWANENVWINPPYCPAQKACKLDCNKIACEKRGKHLEKNIPGQIAWVRKAYEEVKYNSCNVAVLLLPARTDTKLFHDYVMKASMVCFLRGRLQFVGASASAVFPSMLVTFESWQRNSIYTQPIFTTMNSK